MQERIDPRSVVGWGVDADPQNNPTYPMRDISHDDKGGMDWQRPPLQPESVELLQSTEHDRRTAVFGTSTPPRGLSGAIRRRAFRWSEAKWGHWLMLLAADRINVVEGLLQDLERGRVPNVPAEMGIRSELRYNSRGLVKKAAVSGLVVAGALVAVRLLMAERQKPRRH